jgi:Ca2+-binding RTX toxin-like protein
MVRAEHQGETAMAIKGTDGNDTVQGTLFADELFGLGGNDFLIPGPGADTVNGGGETDGVEYAILIGLLTYQSDAVDVDLQRAVQIGGHADGDVLISIENIGGTKKNDTIKGNDGDNELGGNGGDDVLEGRGGDDTLRGDTGLRFVDGESGDDHIDGGAGNDELRGEDGNDTLIGGLDDDQLFGEEGNDTLFGDPGLDVLDGGNGIDTANYENAAAAVSIFLNTGFGFGDAGGDVFIGIENVVGSAFADTLVGSSSANALNGGSGNDTLDGRAGADALFGSSGFDTATYATSAAGVVVDLAAGTGTGGDASGDTLSMIENLIGSNSIDALYGSAFGNTLDGRGGVDLLAGRAGNDVYIVDNAGDAVLENAGEGTDEVRASVSYALAANQAVETLRTTDDGGTAAINLTGNNLVNTVVGNNGDNALNGGGGGDTLIGARGVDILTGGSGADRFLWRDTTESGVDARTADTIVDFDPLAGEIIDLSGIDAAAHAAGNQAFTFIGAAAFSGTPGEINFVQVNGDTIIQLQTDQAVDVEMAIRIPGIVTLDASMFLL